MMAPCRADVFPAGQVLVEAGGHFNQGTDPSSQVASTLRGAEDASEELQDGGFASPVGSNDSKRLASPRLEGDILERPELVSFQFLPWRAQRA